MELEEGIEWVDSCLTARSGQALTETDKVLFESGWLGYKYSKAGEVFGFNPEYLQKIGAVFWRNLTFTLGTKVTKKNLRSVVEHLASQVDQNFEATDSESAQGIDLHSKPVVLGRRPPIVTEYFGYEAELLFLKQSVLERQCVVVVGQAGIGKSLLCSKLVEKLKLPAENQIEKVVWQFMSGHPNLDSLLTEIFDCLDLPQYDSSQDLSVQIAKLLEILQKEKILIVLDGVESMLQGATRDNLYGQNENFSWFLKQLIERPHSSCLLMTSREPFMDLTFAESSGRSVRIMDLNGLGQDSYSLLESQGLMDVDDGFSLLINRYRSNPLLLKLVASRIRNYFGGDVIAFIECDSVLMSESLQEALDNQFRSGVWTPLEQKIMHLLAHNDDNSESLPFQQVFKILKEQESNLSIHKLIAAIDTLVSRSLLERSQVDGEPLILSLQPVIKKYFLNDPSGVIQKSMAA